MKGFVLNTTEISTEEFMAAFCDHLSNKGSNQRQTLIRELLEQMADMTQGTLEEEVYLRALRGMRKKL